MRRREPRRAPIFGAVIAVAAFLMVGAARGKKPNDPPPPKADEVVGNLASVVGSEIKVQGVGLVLGLNNTGSDPPPSWYRQKLLDEMKKANIEHPERWLAHPSTSLVIVRAVIPAGITTKDRFDAEIELPPASGTTSLEGGWLVSTQLAPMAMAGGALRDGQVFGSAYGPVMVGSAAQPNDRRVGRVLGGVRAKNDIPYNLVIKDNRRSVKTAKLLEDVIKMRFHQREGSDLKPMAVGKTDQLLVLKVPRIYHHNQNRYHQVIKLLPVVDNPALRAQRLDQWGKDLLDPKKAGIAALRLEALGTGSIPVLKAGLESQDEQVRFFAAEALAYLGDGAGADVLARVATGRPEFRSFALKALSSMDQVTALVRLRALLSQPEVELRYGAFDALRSLDPTDPFLGRVQVYDEPEEEETDDLAMQIEGAARRRPRPRPEEPFSLYVVDCEGPPLFHVSRNLKCEVVIFGRGQQLLTPVVLGGGGPILLNAADGDNQIQLSKITARALDGPEQRVDCSLDVAAVIRQMAQLGASYPEVVSMLVGAFNQKNLPGPLVVDAIPIANKAYVEAQLLGTDAKKDDELKKTKLDEPKRMSLLERLRERFRR